MTVLTDTLRRLAGQGYTTSEAAAMAGTSRASASNIATRHGFRFMTEGSITVVKVWDCIEANLTQGETARLIGMERSGVYRVARDNGLRFTTRIERAVAAFAEAERLAAEAKAIEDAERMARWHAAAAAKRAAKKAAAPPPPPAPRVVMVDEETLGELMRLAAQRDGMAPRDRRSA